MIERSRIAVLLLLTTYLAGGCSAPSTTLDLITVARKGLISARRQADLQHAEIVDRLKGQAAALDSAFDADVKLAAAGQIITPDGKTVAFTPQWVISARKGYIAARDMLADQVRSAEAAHAAGQDNLKVADESLQMASHLIVQQWNVAEQIKQHVLSIQRSLVND